MASNRHKDHMKKYLQSHKSSGKVSPNKHSISPSSEKKTPCSSSQSVRHKGASKLHPVSIAKGSCKPCLAGMPDEILLKIFSFFSLKDLHKVGAVCKRWLHLSSDNVIWRQFFRAIFGPKKAKNREVPSPMPHDFWKASCYKEAISERNKLLLKGKQRTKAKVQIDRFTGLEKGVHQSLLKLNIKWVLGIVMKSGNEERLLWFNDSFKFPMSLCVRWYGLTFPALTRIHKLRVYAARPIFVYPQGHAVPDSPCLKSLLLEVPFNQSILDDSTHGIFGDDKVQVHALSEGLLVATWTDGGEIAFVTCCLHNHGLQARCLEGTVDRQFIPTQAKPRRDDIDSQRGLHGYSCTADLRNHRSSMWSEQYQNLYCKPENITSNAVVFQLVKPGNRYGHSTLDKAICLPWKTEVFRGKIENVCILDISLLDEDGKPIWCFSNPVKVIKIESSPVSYEYDGDVFHIECADKVGSINMELVWEHDYQKYYIVKFDVLLNLEYVNHWFGTKYLGNSTPK